MSGSVYKNPKLKSEMLKEANTTEEKVTSGGNTYNKGGNITTYDLDSELYQIINDIKSEGDNVNIDIDGGGGISNTVNLGVTSGELDAKLEALRSQLSGGATGNVSVKVLGSWRNRESDLTKFYYRAKLIRVTIPTPTQSLQFDSSDIDYIYTYDVPNTVDIVTVDFYNLDATERKLVRNFGTGYGRYMYGDPDDEYCIPNAKEEGMLPIPSYGYGLSTYDYSDNPTSHPPVKSTSVSSIYMNGNSAPALMSSNNTVDIPLPKILYSNIMSRDRSIRTNAFELTHNGYNAYEVFPVDVYGQTEWLMRNFNDIPNDRIDAGLFRIEDFSHNYHYYFSIRNTSPYKASGSATLILM